MTLLHSQLESFLAVAAVSSVTDAAKRLHLTQPAVTKQVRGLERTLGVQLLERSARGVRLTEAGELVHDYGRRSAALLDECRAALDDLTQGGTGRLAIGAGVTTSMFQLPQWLSSYRRQWPAVDVAVRTGSSAAVAELVRQREIDCGFVTSDVPRRELSIQSLYSEDVVLVVSASAQYPARVALESVPLIMFPRHAGFRRFLDRAFSVAGITAQVKMEIDSVEATKSLVEVGLGGAFLPLTAVRLELQHERLVRLRVKDMPRLRRRTMLVRREDRRPSRALKHFLSVIGTT